MTYFEKHSLLFLPTLNILVFIFLTTLNEIFLAIGLFTLSIAHTIDEFFLVYVIIHIGLIFLILTLIQGKFLFIESKWLFQYRKTFAEFVQDNVYSVGTALFFGFFFFSGLVVSLLAGSIEFVVIFGVLVTFILVFIKIQHGKQWERLKNTPLPDSEFKTVTGSWRVNNDGQIGPYYTEEVVEHIKNRDGLFCSYHRTQKAVLSCSYCTRNLCEGDYHEKIFQHFDRPDTSLFTCIPCIHKDQMKILSGDNSLLNVLRAIILYSFMALIGLLLITIVLFPNPDLINDSASNRIPLGLVGLVFILFSIIRVHYNIMKKIQAPDKITKLKEADYLFYQK